jgi:hypothetical protein
MRLLTHVASSLEVSWKCDIVSWRGGVVDCHGGFVEDHKSLGNDDKTPGTSKRARDDPSKVLICSCVRRVS